MKEMRWTAKRHYDVLENGICRNLHRVRVGYILNQIAAVKNKAGKPLRILDRLCENPVFDAIVNYNSLILLERIFENLTFHTACRYRMRGWCYYNKDTGSLS